MENKTKSKVVTFPASESGCDQAVMHNIWDQDKKRDGWILCTDVLKCKDAHVSISPVC